jgi:WD40 repeat protein
MTPQSDLDGLQAFLDGELSIEEVSAIEARLKAEPALAEALVCLAREEVVLTEWARVVTKASQLTLRTERKPRVVVSVVTRDRWVASIAAALLVALGMSLWLRSQESTAAAVVARLEHVEGQVFVTKFDSRTLATAGQNLHSGQGLAVVGEESSAAVVYADGTRLELDGDATVSELSGGVTTGKHVVLAEGNLRADVAKQPLGLPMILTTPSAEVVVLGTKFDLTGRLDATYVETAEGRVRLTRTSDGRSIEVPAGFEGIASGDASLDAHLSPPRLHEPRFSMPGCDQTTALSSDGKTLITSRFKSGSFTIWNVADGSERMTVEAHAQQIVATAFSTDSTKLATAGLDQKIKLWNVNTGQILSTLEAPGLVQTITFSNGGETIVGLAGPPQKEKMLTSWNLSTGEPQTGSDRYRGEFWIFSPKGQTLAMSSTRTSSVTLWDTASGREQAVFHGFASRVLSMAISPDESLLAVSDASGRVTLWDIPAAKLQFTFHPAGQTVQGLAFSADGTRLAMGQRHATVRLWDVATGKQQAILEGPAKPGSTATVRPMFFSPDGKTLATTESLEDSTVRVWDLPKK